MIYSEDRRSLSSLVLKHCAVPDGADREDAWDRVVAPTIAKKYADMRCNINNNVRKAFQGMKLFYHFCSIGIVISPISALLADPNRNKIDPDTLIKGISTFYAECTETNHHPFYDFNARYVRKLHSDRYIKTTLEANKGMSFLDIIWASDIAYIICLIKNSMEIWKYDPADTMKTMPKPLFTRGETKKRQFGKTTTMSNDGMKYFQKSISNWKMVFNDWGGDVYGSLVQGWSAWLEEEASAIDIDGGWRRKNLHSLLRTREEKEDPEGDDAADEGQNGEVGELFCYDSDGDEGFMAPVARGGQRGMMDADREDEGEGEGTIVDDNENRKRGYEDEEDKDENDDKEEEEEEEQGKGRNRGANAGNKRKRGETTGMGRKSRAKSK